MWVPHQGPATKLPLKTENRRQSGLCAGAPTAGEEPGKNKVVAAELGMRLVNGFQRVTPPRRGFFFPLSEGRSCRVPPLDSTIWGGGTAGVAAASPQCPQRVLSCDKTSFSAHKTRAAAAVACLPSTYLGQGLCQGTGTWGRATSPPKLTSSKVLFLFPEAGVKGEEKPRSQKSPPPRLPQSLGSSSPG